MAWYGWAPYVPVAQRRSSAKRKMAELRKKGVDIQPVEIEGRTIARTFWGKGWCDHLESFSDYENRLPRGRTYVRNGSVCHLAISKGKIEAKVSGSEIYDLLIQIEPLAAAKWKSIKRRCTGQIGSLVELLQGRLSDSVMEVVTDRRNGLFPLPHEISLDCDCPDWAIMCKHVAAVLYGAGTRLDTQPELLFKLRGVNHEELIDADAAINVGSRKRSGQSKRLKTDDLSDVFGIDLDVTDTVAPDRAKPKSPAKKKPGRKKAVKRKAVKKKAVKKKASSGTSFKASVKATAKKRKASASSSTKKPAVSKIKVKAKKSAEQGTRTASRKKPTTSKRSATKTTIGKQTARRKKK